MKHHQVVRETKGTSRVVCCIPKEYGSTEAARFSRLQLAKLVKASVFRTGDCWFDSNIVHKKAKSASVGSENHLTLRT